MNTVQRNFYVNDVGGQANTFAASVLHFYKLHFGQPSELPERGYATPNVRELAEEIAGAEGDRLLALPEHEQQEAMRELSITRQVAKIRATAERTGIHFDSWSNQSELITSGRSAKTLEILKEQGKTIEKEGALWLAGVEEDDRESVLVKSDGTNTYFLDDIAFYRMKLEEWGNDYGICVLGGNHFGHIPRMQAALAALGMDAARYKGTLYQQVQLKEGGERKTMSKREGNFVTADEVLDQIPLDVFNWFMLSKTAETHLDFDLQLAKDTSEKNPVYYVQYAHARICSVLERAGEYDKNITMTETYNPEERSLIRHLSNFTAVLEDIAFSYRTHLLPTYIFELATRYHHFYAHHRVMADEPATAALRIRLSELTAKTLKQGLELLNISAPTHMER
jgi:arginyl-tRNA synthetase